MGAYNKVLSLALATASANNIALSQSVVGAAAVTINGSTATAGVATLDTARRVLITSAGNDSGITFKLTGTDRNGNVITETITGANTSSVFTLRDFLTITSIVTSGSTAAAITVGTNGIASTAPFIIDRFVSATNITAAGVVSGTINWSAEVCYTDFAPAWNLNGTTLPTWFAPQNTTKLTSQTGNSNDVVNLPITMIRLTQNSFSAGGTVSLTVNVPMKFV